MTASWGIDVRLTSVPRDYRGFVLSLSHTVTIRVCEMMSEQQSEKPLRILSYPELKSRKGIRWSYMQVYRHVKARRFPAPITLGTRTVGWVEDEVDQWLRDRIAQRDATSAA